jgi:hypothetical protein
MPRIPPDAKDLLILDFNQQPAHGRTVAAKRSVNHPHSEDLLISDPRLELIGQLL